MRFLPGLCVGLIAGLRPIRLRGLLARLLLPGLILLLLILLLLGLLLLIALLCLLAVLRLLIGLLLFLLLLHAAQEFEIFLRIRAPGLALQ